VAYDDFTQFSKPSSYVYDGYGSRSCQKVSFWDVDVSKICVKLSFSFCG
jgi:hypothetical protein